MSEDIKGSCEGCTVHSSVCLWFSETITCPCSICLIKVMCTDTCDLLMKHQDKIHDLNLIKKGT